MRIDVLTLFPSMFVPFLEESIIGRAIKSEKVEVYIHNIRDYSMDPHHKVDDYGFGGGDGMVLMPDPIYRAVDDLKKEDTKIILLTPQGKTFKQEIAYNLSGEKHLLFICGHYEGFDERIRALADIELSIGDYVLTGGELPSMIIMDSIIRLLKGVIKDGSHTNDSFQENLLDYPVYTKPRNYRGMEVPEVLFSGHHENIKKWRYEQQIERTKARRPDLLEKR